MSGFHCHCSFLSPAGLLVLQLPVPLGAELVAGPGCVHRAHGCHRGIPVHEDGAQGDTPQLSPEVQRVDSGPVDTPLEVGPPNTLSRSDPPAEVQPRSWRNPGNVKCVGVRESETPSRRQGVGQAHSYEDGNPVLEPLRPRSQQGDLTEDPNRSGAMSLLSHHTCHQPVLCFCLFLKKRTMKSRISDWSKPLVFTCHPSIQCCCDLAAMATVILLGEARDFWIQSCRKM